MKVKVLHPTFTLKYGHLKRGDLIEVDEKDASRWIKVGLATADASKKIKEPLKVNEPVKVDEPAVENELQKESLEPVTEFEDMSFADLRKLVKERGFEAYGKLNKAGLIELLKGEEEKDDEQEEKNLFFDGSYEE